MANAICAAASHFGPRDSSAEEPERMREHHHRTISRYDTPPTSSQGIGNSNAARQVLSDRDLDAVGDYLAEKRIVGGARGTTVSTRGSQRRGDTSRAKSAEAFRIADGKFVGYWCFTTSPVSCGSSPRSPSAHRPERRDDDDH